MQEKREHLENLHIPLWLLKDTCWMLEWKTLGVIMIFPTVFLAIRIAVHTYKTVYFLPNLAVCFWIGANAYWMVCEFFFNNVGKHYAVILFVMGLCTIFLYYFNKMRERKRISSQ